MGQAQKVYGAEGTTFANVMQKSNAYILPERFKDGSAMFIGRDAVIKYANAALAACGCKPLGAFQTGTGHHGWSRFCDRKICLPRDLWNRFYILHEVAHLVAADYGFEGPGTNDHGPGFTGTMLAVVALVCGPGVAAELARDYREAWVDVSVRAFTNVAGRGIEECER